VQNDGYPTAQPLTDELPFLLHLSQGDHCSGLSKGWSFTLLEWRPARACTSIRWT
jgi:hypothetical protein